MTLEEKVVVESIKDQDLQALAAMVGMQGELIRKRLRGIELALWFIYCMGCFFYILARLS